MSALLQQMRADSPAALWRCAETSGSVVSDASGSGRNLDIGAEEVGEFFLPVRIFEFEKKSS